MLLFLFQKCNNAYRETFGFAVVQASVQGLLGDLSGVHGKVKRDSGEFQRALGKNLCSCSYFYVHFLTTFKKYIFCMNLVLHQINWLCCFILFLMYS